MISVALSTGVMTCSQTPVTTRPNANPASPVVTPPTNVERRKSATAVVSMARSRRQTPRTARRHPSAKWRVGWVERSETHRLSRLSPSQLVGYGAARLTHPTHPLARAMTPSMLQARGLLRRHPPDLVGEAVGE